MSERTYDFSKRLGVDFSKAKPKGDGTYYAFCPFCHHERKREHLRQREFWFSELTGNYECHNCGKKGRLDCEEYIAYKENLNLQTTKSKPMKTVDKQQGPNLPQNSKSFHQASINPCGQTVRNYLQNVRKISPEAIDSLKIGEDKQWFTKLNREAKCVVFNYYLDDKLVNQKHRAIDTKDFLQTPGCRTVPYNIDAIRSPLDENGKRQPVYIVEGEMDVAAMVSAGFYRTISIPNGAAANINWIDEFWETHFKGVEKYVIAVDTDKPGEQLAERLIERLGPDRCDRMTFGEQCKDANDCLIKFGLETLKDFEIKKKPCPLKDVTFPADIKDVMDRYFKEGAQCGHMTGWEGPSDAKKEDGKEFYGLDDIIQWETKQLCLITGLTGDGKSEFLDELVIRLSMEAEWKAIYYTPENFPIQRHISKLCEKLVGKEFPKAQIDCSSDTYINKEEYEEAYEWITENISYYTPEKDETNVEDLRKNVDYIVQRKGAKILVIDPFNYIDKEVKNEFEVNRRDSQIISDIRNIAIQRNMLVFLVAHPRKPSLDLAGNRRRVSMYDISGTADLVNKADICMVIERSTKNDMTTVYVDKVRNKDFGNRGKCHFLYHPENGRFSSCAEIKGNPNEYDESKKDNFQDYVDECKKYYFDQTNWLRPDEAEAPCTVRRPNQATSPATKPKKPHAIQEDLPF